MDQRAALTRRAALFVVSAAFAASLATARAQDGAPIHVRSFVLSSSAAVVPVGGTIHMIVDARVDEKMDQLGQVTLPDLSGFDSLADERRVTLDAKGTHYVETVTLRPTAPGTIRLSGASLVAVDATSGALSRFTTNPLTLVVLPASAKTSSPAPSPAAATHAPVPAAIDSRWWLLVAAVAIAALETVLLVRRRRKTAIGTVTRMNVPEEEETFSFEAPLAPRVSEAERFRMIIANITLRPTRQRIVLLRDYLRERAGARDDETFGDLLARLAQSDRGPLVNALRLVERAAFIGDEHLVVAINECVPALRTYADWLDEKSA